MNPIQQAIANRNKKLVLGAGIVAVVLWILLVGYLYVDSKKEPSYAKPGIVSVRSSSPVANVKPVSTSYTLIQSTTPFRHHTTVSAPNWSMVPAPTMGNTSSMHLYQTSSATVHSLGGGGNGGGITVTGGNNSARGIHSTASSYGNMLSLAASVPLASPGATEPTEMAHIAAAPERHDNTTVRKVTGNPLDPFLDPVGDVTWGLMALLLGAYGYHLFVRKRPQRSETNK